MSDAFGTKFVVVNDVEQTLPTHIFTKGPWIHMATIVRGFKEYLVFRKKGDKHAYIEEVDNTHPGLLKKIKSDAEWNDLVEFCLEKGILKLEIDKEKKINNRLLVGK